MSSFGTPTFSFPKLNASNYETWCCDIKYLLLERGCWRIVIGKEIPPESLPTNEANVRDFERRRDTAVALLYQTVDSGYRQIIEDCDDPGKAWKLLQSHFQPDNRSRHMRLFTELCECRIRDNESISLFSSRLLRIADQLRSLDPSFSEIYVTFQILRYLPQRFDTVVHILLRWPKEKFVFSSVLQELIAEEARLDLRDQDHSNGAAAQNVSVSQRRRNFKCYSCGQVGHLARFCHLRSHQKGDGSPSRRNFRQVSGRSPSRSKSPGNRFSQRKFNKSFSGHSNNSSFAFYVSANLSHYQQSTNIWYLDSAATHHFSNCRSLFSKFTKISGKHMSCAANKVKIPILGIGDIKLKIGENNILLNNVYFAPELRCNLLSLTKLDEGGAQFSGGKRCIVIHFNGNFVCRANLLNGLYQLKSSLPNSNAVDSKINQPVSAQKSQVISAGQKSRRGVNNLYNSLMKLHRRFAHVNCNYIAETSKHKAVKGLPSIQNYSGFQCEPCSLNKFKSVSFKQLAEKRATKPFQLVYADVWGPMKTEGRNRQRYFVSLIDDYSRKTVIYPIRNKSDVFPTLRNHILRTENILRTKLQCFRSDNGTEFNNSDFANFFTSKGIVHEFTNAYTPQQNGVPERYNQTIVAGARALLNESGMPTNFWPDALSHFNYTWNRVCRTGLEKTPFQLFYSHQPSIRHLRPFGCVAYVGVPFPKRKSKFDETAQKGYLVGYSVKTKGYRVWIPDTNQVVNTVNVKFNENEFYKNRHIIDNQVDSSIYTPSSVEPFSDMLDTVPTQPVEVPTTSGEKVVDKAVIPTPKKIHWYRCPQSRMLGNRTDIYFYPEDTNCRLRSLKEIKKYCHSNNILFEPSVFNFSGKDLKEGKVGGSDTSEDVLDDPDDSTNASCSHS